MEQIIEVGGRRYIVGLEWIKLAGNDPMLAAKAQAKTRKSPLGVIRTVDIGEGQKLSQVGLSHKKVKGVVYSGAAHLANLYPSMIAIDKISDDLYWICVTENGRVLPGHDVPASDSEIKRMFNELCTDYQLDYMTLIMPEAVAETFGITSSFQDISPIDLLDDASGYEATKLKNLAGIPNSVYLGAAIAIIVGGWVGNGKYQAYQLEKEREVLLAMQAMEEEARKQAELEREKRLRSKPTEAQILQMAREEEIIWLRDDFNKTPLISLLELSFESADKMPTRLKGWELEGFTFTSDKSSALNTSWLRKNGLLEDLDVIFKSNASVSFSNDLSKGYVAHPFELGTRGIEDIMSHLKERGTTYQNLSDDLFRARLEFKISVIPEMERRELIQNIENKQLASVPQLMVRKRKFEIVGSSKESFAKLMSAIRQVDNMLPTELLISRINGSYSWKFTGILHEL